MLKKTIKFKDYYGVDREEDFYFNLEQNELTKMSFTEDGQLDRIMTRIAQTQDQKKIMEYFDEFITMSYGERDPEGKMFRKFDDDGHRLANRFKQTKAYDVLFMELMNDSDALSQFFKEILPENVQAQIEEEERKQKQNLENKVVPIASVSDKPKS